MDINEMIVSAKPAGVVSDLTDRPSLRWVFDVSPQVCNRHGTLHGGVVSWWCSGLTMRHLLLAHLGEKMDLQDGDEKGNGASSPLLGARGERLETATFHIALVRGVPRGGKVAITTKAVKVGRTMAFIEATVTSPDDEAVVYYRAQHAIMIHSVPKVKSHM
jgi:acyl-coenzyme A thioesterase PaaI-like protein